jgi:PPK2 family polyphosphate:nucleotide phosphotransferase
MDEPTEQQLRTLAERVDVHRARPGEPVDLAAVDPRGTPAWDGDKDAGVRAAAGLNDRLEALQEQLFAEGRHRLLVVLQATDTAGKDSTIRHVFDGVDPQGVTVAAFKKPTEEELARDYLWRVHAHVPRDGRIAIFNRSHYEDVLVVRVHGLVPEARWRRRYDHIAAFERLLADEGTTVVKFFLHISAAEQAERLQARLDDPEKHWKFAVGDLAERERWDDYQAAFAEAIERTTADHAPWYVVPADRRWYRNLVVSQVLVSTLESFDMRWPEPEPGLEDVVIT